ncbi:MAG: DUF2242 domain-containing protein [Dechloromonas sp.]|nr:DUF2242 domain-containing protein [Dechloromonas sp.]
MSRLVLALLAACLLLTACASKVPSAYRAETFEPETPFQFHTELDSEALCDKGRRALLSQGYDVELSAPTNIRGAKFFLPAPNQQLQLRISLVCLASSNGATLYANALQSRYEMKADSNSTGLSVAGLGSISLPWSSESGTLVKVGDETVTDPAFYQRLFVLIENIKD